MDVHELAGENENHALEAEHARQNGTLHGYRLLLARCAGAMLTVLIVAFFIANLPVYFTQLQTVCVQAICIQWQLTASSARALQGAGLSLRLYAIFSLALTLFLAFVWFAVGAYIAWRKSDNWLALLTSLLLMLQVVMGLCGFLSNGGIALPLAYSSSVWYVPTIFFSLLDVALIILVFSLFPNGRFVPGWMGWYVPIGTGLMIILTLFFFSSWPMARTTGLLLLITALWLFIVIAIIGGQIYRYRRVSGPTERQQIKWIVFGTIVELTLGLVYIFPLLLFPQLRTPGSLYFFLVKPLVFLPSLFGPVCFGIAILRYRLWDIDGIINRTLVYAALSACVIGLYMLIVVGFGSLLQARGNLFLSLLATGLIAVLFQPLRDRLQQGVNRLMFGERDEPYRVLFHLGQRLEESLPAGALLPTIVETVAHALKLPYVAIVWNQGSASRDGETPQVAAAFGTATNWCTYTRLPLVHQGEQVGELVLSPRSRGERLAAADLRLLRNLAPQIGIAVYSARLTTDLQRSRERLVTTREEERRRLRRDLHDGLGPQLSSQTLLLSAIRKFLRQDPERAEQLLVAATSHAQEAIADIRRLVYALRPSALDDLGLLAALQEQMNQYHISGMMLILEAPTVLPPLPAAIEVACYRIAQEALTNVVRHSHATHVTVALHLEQAALAVEVRDNGQGLPPAVRNGVGLTSIRERAEELGGTCLVEAIAEGGTRVYARLPLSVRHSEKNKLAEKGEGSDEPSSCVDCR